MQTACENCLKIPELCVCSEIRALKTRTHVLILQHPQEPDKDLGSARIAHLSLPNSTLKIGLSWRNLSAAFGPAAGREVQPGRWATLYLGSGTKGAQAGGAKPPGLQLVSKQSEPLPDSDALLQSLEGIVVLDGTWSQAKTLWWRNAWLLKLRRAILSPERPSLYRELRREPRRECLSTIESIAQGLKALGEPAETTDGLTQLFGKLLQKQRTRQIVRREPKSRP